MTTADGEEPGWFRNPDARTFRAPAADHAGAARRFHRTVPGYAMTQLTDVPDLARRWRVGRVFVKDESTRFGLPAFKALGASWAIARILAERSGSAGLPTYDDALAAAADQELCLVTATDGNHGRAVAHFARLLGLRSVVVIPDFVGVEPERAIAGEGAEVRRVEGTYDDAVRAAVELADAAHGADERILVQDMGWPGYESVPAWIVDGYATMADEVSEQLAASGVGAPDLVAVPVGVGSLAAAMVAYYRGPDSSPRPAVLSCEPASAACLLASLSAARPVTVPTGHTVMAGLNCGTVSGAAWPLLQSGVDAAVTVTEDQATRAVAELAGFGVSAGASGAATLAGVDAALSGSGAGQRRADLGLHAGSVVVLLNTEGATGAGGLRSERDR
ncbi:MAG: diaminopropionate ammonia-lyase [Actinomycetales bacterium]